MKKYIFMILLILCAFTAVLSGCTDGSQTENTGAESSDSAPSEIRTESATDADRRQALQPEEDEAEEEPATEVANMDRTMIVEVNGTHFTAALEDNEAVDALLTMMQEKPITIQMTDYSGFEKVGALGTSLPTSNSQTTTQSGDIVLYQGNQIVIFYGSNSWSYTRLGKIDDLTGWKDALGSGDVTVTFSMEE